MSVKTLEQSRFLLADFKMYFGRRIALSLLALLLFCGLVAITFAYPSGGDDNLRTVALIGLSMAFAIVVYAVFLSKSKDWTNLTGLAVSEPWTVMEKSGDIVYASQGLGMLLPGASRPLARFEHLRLMITDDISVAALEQLRKALSEGVEDQAALLINREDEGPVWHDILLRQIAGEPENMVCILKRQSDGSPDQPNTISGDPDNDTDQALLNDIPIGLYSLDQEGRFVSVNDVFCQRLEYERDDLLNGMTLQDLVKGKFTAPVGYDGPFQVGRITRFELNLVTGSGTEMVVRVDQTITEVDAGGSWQTRSVIRRTDAERALRLAVRAAEERFDRFFKFAPVAILILNAEFRITEANPTFEYLKPPKFDLANHTIFDLFSREDEAEVKQRLQETLVGTTWDDVPEVKIQAQDGDRFVRLYASRLGDDTEGQNGLLLQLVDTTEQRNLELQFAQSQKMQAVGQLAGGVAHDFNNLLTAIIGHCDLLLLRTRPGDELFPDIMQVKQNANRAANLVRQLLAFSRQQTLRPKVLSLTDVLAELTHLIRRLIGENIELGISHGADLWPVLVDQGQFEQVAINLAVNARDAMQNGGRLTIKTQNVSKDDASRIRNQLMPVGEYVLIEISDEGKGIPPTDLGRIFEPFFTTKSQSSGSAGGSGTGLGLSTVFGIIKQTGGFIFPESTIDVGTTFRIYLPRHVTAVRDVSEEVDEVTDIEKSTQDLTGKGTILLVEDEDAVRVFAARALKNKGYTVIEADGGETALQELDAVNGKVDLIISDVVMPQMDGPTLIKKVRETQPNLKVVFISGYAEDAFRKNMDPGAEFELLPKPFSLKQLASKVKEVMNAN